MTDPQAAWRDYLKSPPSGGGPRIAVAASFTAEPLAPYLGAHLLGKGLAPVITFGPFNQMHRACLDHKGVFGEEPDVIVLLWRAEDMFPDLMEHPERLLAEIRDFAGAVRALRANFSGTLVVSTPPYPALPAFDVRDLEQPTAGAALHAAVLQAWLAEVGGIERARILDLNGLMMKTGMDAALDPVKWRLYRQPYNGTFWQAMGTQLGRIVAAQKVSAKKCLVLDADNTLWGGIVGEDGVGGIALGDDFPGSAFRDFQKYALHLKKKGILLAVASKNDPDDFFEAFDAHDAMVLKRADVSVFEVHWESKVDSLRRIAEKLGIGTDALVFVDDSAKEIGEVRERLPEVACLMVPEETALLPDLLRGSDLFDLADITGEDRNRAEMIAAEQARRQSRDTLSEAEFRAALGLAVDVFRAGKQHIARITQLINKTNQFNLTTRRRTQDEVEALARSKDHLVLGMELRDKYGAYGLVGAAVLEKQGETCVIDTLLMSCRVLGRNAEDAFMAGIAAAAQAMGCAGISGSYIPTPKNGMVKDLYKNFGLKPQNGAWHIAAAGIPPAPAHIDFRITLPAEKP